MTPRTVGTKHDAGRVVPIECIRNDDLCDLDIKDKCFLLILVKKGRATFSVHGRRAEAAAPCIVCFDETEDPVLVGKRGLRCDSVYFAPTFLNPNMTFGTVRDEGYADIAEKHDMFLMKRALRLSAFRRAGRARQDHIRRPDEGTQGSARLVLVVQEQIVFHGGAPHS